jgi:mannose-1-phosphate guanylyltransferase
MKAMILAAGCGRRMLPLTQFWAKPALPVLNRPLIHWTLERLARQGVKEVIVNLHHLPSTLTRVVGRGTPFGLEVTYSRERKLLGTGGGPRRVRDFFGDAPFLLVNGDVVFDFDLAKLVARHRARGALATLALRPNPDPRVYGAVVTAADGRVRSLAGLPRREPGRISLFTGVQILDPALLEELPEGPSDIVRDLYARVVERGLVLGVQARGAWYDFGTPQLYLASQLDMLSSRSLTDPSAVLGEGARISRSVVGGGTRIARGAYVTGSILWEGVRVGEGARIEGSILAHGARAPKGGRVKNRLLLPGHSSVLARRRR